MMGKHERILAVACIVSISIGLDREAQAQDVRTLESAARSPAVDGALTWGEWDLSRRADFDLGSVAVHNDDRRVYFLIDTALEDEDPADYFWLTFDVDRDGKITPGVDVNYVFLSETGEIRPQYYLGPGEWTGLLPETR